MRKQQNFQFDSLSLGVCYYPEHWDKSLWRDDLRRMKEAGIGTVRIAEFAWSVFEPTEEIFSFDFFDSFLDLCEEMGMKVIFGTPTSIPPVWLTEKYPEVLNARKDGVLFRHGMRRHYNYNSPTLHRLAARVVEKVAEHYAKRPCIVGWQIDNELNCEINEYYSESDTLAFRDFLKEKYGTLDKLNDAWGAVFWNQTYTAWNQVYVPRTTINGHTNPHQHMDYIRFVSESTIRFCKMQSDILRKFVKAGDFITTNGMFGNLDNHKMCDEALDVFTYDSYPNFAFARSADPKNSTNLNDRNKSQKLTEVRSVCPHFGIMEQQSGAGDWVTNNGAPAPKPGQMTLWAMQSIAHGADYISFFRWRTATFGTEIYWHGILDYDNRDNRKLAEVKQIAKRVQAIGEMTGADFKAPLGLVRDYDNIWDAQLDKWHKAFADSSELEIFAAAQLSHTPMDAVTLLDSTDAGELAKYAVLIYPHPVILTEQRAALLREYVEQGDTLIIGARAGQKDTHGHCVMSPMPGLLAGLTQTAVKEFTFVGPADEPVAVEWGGRKMESGIFHDILETTGLDAKVLATYGGDYYEGEPALVETPMGKGKVLHFGGTFTRDNVRELLQYTGIFEPFAQYVTLPADCELVVREKNGQTYCFVLNYSKDSQEIALQNPMLDMDTQETVSGKITMEAYGTKVYKII